MRKLLCIALLLSGCDDPNRSDLQQPTGVGETVFTLEDDPNSPFFQELGTNQRTCATCHERAAGWSITPTLLQARFDATEGMDPIFRAIDGATSPNANVDSLDARTDAYRLLLDKGLIRVGLPMPNNAEFTVRDVSDPYGFAGAGELSLFRRPLPATNLRFLAEIMWDAREPALDKQAFDATMGHAQAETVRSEEEIARIVAFESSSYTAQRMDDIAGDLSSDGARGGAAALVDLDFHVGINDPFDRRVFTLYDAWEDADTSTKPGEQRAAIARGQRLFNTKRFRIRGVAGLADQQGTCSTCHNTPNVGSHSMALPLNIGVSDEDRDTSDLPLYTLRNNSTGDEVQTTDPGLAMITGRWNDIGRFKVPSLRGLAMRPPYFHNGRAENLGDVLRFYRQKFDVDFDGGEQDDLVAFLSAL